MRKTFAAALIATLPLAAQAQDRPPLFPTRDVAVTYRVAGPGGQPAELTMQWLAAQQMMRMNMPGGVAYVVADHRNQRGFMVMEATRSIMDVPMQQAAGMQRELQNANFTRGGTATVAGTECTIWRYQAQAQSGEACITADGVMLRAQGASQGQQGQMEAVNVAYGAQNPAQFQRPQGYQTMQMPQGAAPR
ncbi:DUF4412 domain-containing protein [Roseomonas terrae]|jgi:hypothetical protein|uniref:DUF4412 domain-containing protein n=1 Tax=Neoroseomonas terrae TaxID=424799 RepID=A0ABS5ENQ9_9PROT|nr:DUF4412 domain-containing protein [Neoroseomonas terrae]MBR0652642.1 DUF4412 domain-containing protein [Neoroseomonas terrae]